MNARWLSPLLAACLLLAGCPDAATPDAAPKSDAAAPAASPAPPPAGDSGAEVAPAPAPAPETPAVPVPDAARQVPEDLLTQDGVNYGCRTNADCAVKDVGNCCGYYPACVNKDSPTFPEQVKAACATSGMQSICGFQEIASCQCVEGRCAPLGGPGGTLQ